MCIYNHHHQDTFDDNAVIRQVRCGIAQLYSPDVKIPDLQLFIDQDPSNPLPDWRTLNSLSTEAFAITLITRITSLTYNNNNFNNNSNDNKNNKKDVDK